MASSSQIYPESVNAGAYLHSFQSPSPEAPLQTFGHQGQAPFGYALGHSPKVVAPDLGSLEAKQPVYHIKVTATPVNVPVGNEAPEYVVSADPVAAGFPAVATTREGTVVTHAAPDMTVGRKGFTIKPLHYNISRHMGPEGSPVPSELAAERHAQGLVHVYSGLPKEETPAGTLPGTQPLEHGYSRTLARPPSGGEIEIDEKERIYNWIIPSGGELTGIDKPATVPQPAVEKPVKTGFLESLLGKLAGRKSATPSEESGKNGAEERRRSRDASELFATASGEFREHALEERDTLASETQIISSATDEELGLPSILRPSIRYGGVEFAPPEYAGTKGPLNYKLHAIEVHQYIPLPTTDEPWFSRNHLNPSTNAIFGPMPLPFDPAHSGMVAPTFQQTIENHPAPVLSPEIARMFNHELPVVTRVTE